MIFEVPFWNLKDGGANGKYQTRHIGASIKDAGKKCFGISLIDDPGVVAELLNRLKTV